MGDGIRFNIERLTTERNIQITHPMLQWKTELEEFCAFMIERNVRSFLEIGSATGQLSVFIKDALCMEQVSACDINFPPLFEYRTDISFHHGNHQAASYLDWRRKLGLIDMVFIDADHYTGFRKDYEIELQFAHRFIAFHDIANHLYPALKRFWEKEVKGNKASFVNTDPNIRFGVPELEYPFLWFESPEELESSCGRSCGIGVSWEDEAT